MHHSDPMKYTMEQLVKALTAEALGEVSNNNLMLQQECACEDNDDNENLENNTKWDQVAQALVAEIKNQFSGISVRANGPEAEECIDSLASLVSLYSEYPMAFKLLSAVEKIASDETDSRVFASLIVQAMNSDAADEWKRYNQHK